MFASFFTNSKLLIPYHLQKGEKYSQDYIFSDVIPELKREKNEIEVEKARLDFDVHMDNSKSHGDRKIQEKFDTNSLIRSSDPPYSSDLSSDDFCFFGMAKGKMKDRKFHTVQDVLGRLTQIWNDITFEDVRSVFIEWQIPVNWILDNGEEYYSEQSKKTGN
jgi:hypothetical protein